MIQAVNQMLLYRQNYARYVANDDPATDASAYDFVALQDLVTVADGKPTAYSRTFNTNICV